MFIKYRFFLVWSFFYFISFYNINYAVGVEVEQNTAYTSSSSFTFEGSYDANNEAAGVVYEETGTNKIIYISRWSAQETVVTPSSGENFGDAFLVYDSSSNPHVFVPLSSTDIVHFYKSGGTWIRETVFQLNTSTYPDLSNNITALKIDYAGSFHILCTADYAVSYITNKTGSWSTEPEIVESLSGFTNPYSFSTYVRGNADMEIDTSNYAHVIYSTLFETRYLTNQSGAWVGENVYSDQDIDYWYAEDPVIALNSSDNPAILAMEQDHATTGSILYSKLRYIVRSGSSWTSSYIATSADSYIGGDGNNFTGANANLVFDSQGRPHILFSDIASSHNSSSANYKKFGQIRYGYYDGSSWNLSTLYTQSQDSGEMLKLWLGISSDGSNVYFYGGEAARIGDPYAGYSSATYNLLYFAPPSSDSTAPTTTASPAGGYYSSSQSVTLTCTDNTDGSGCNKTYYTIDDSTPSSSSSVFSSAITISSNTTLKFFSIDVDGNSETINTETYVIDSTVPTNPSVSINNNANSTDDLSLTLSLSATDATGVTGYYCSESASTPSASASGWISVVSAVDYSDNVPFVMSSDQGTKTVYVWFKDAAGNISSPANDTITSTFIPTLSEWGMIALVILLLISSIFIMLNRSTRAM